MALRQWLEHIRPARWASGGCNRLAHLVRRWRDVGDSRVLSRSPLDGCQGRLLADAIADGHAVFFGDSQPNPVTLPVRVRDAIGNADAQRQWNAQQHDFSQRISKRNCNSQFVCDGITNAHRLTVRERNTDVNAYPVAVGDRLTIADREPDADTVWRRDALADAEFVRIWERNTDRHGLGYPLRKRQRHRNAQPVGDTERNGLVELDGVTKPVIEPDADRNAKPKCNWHSVGVRNAVDLRVAKRVSYPQQLGQSELYGDADVHAVADRDAHCIDVIDAEPESGGIPVTVLLSFSHSHA